MKQHPDTTLYIIGSIAIIGIITSSYLAFESNKKTNEINRLTQDKNQLTKSINNTNNELSLVNSQNEELENNLAELKEDLEDLADDYKDERNRNEDFEDQIRSLSGTLGDLDKLTKTDKELLAKYSKVYFLNENYVPRKVEKIPEKYILEGKNDQYFHADAIDHLEDLLRAAKRDDIDLKVVSAYRSFDEQTDLKDQFTQVYGSGANTFSADQGYSEHQLGTTIDFTTQEIGGTYTSFAETAAYKWLQDNAYKYGFILSYPEDNGFYIFEPWHWRFVGTNLARHLDRSDDTFYTMDQREIDEYLLELFD